MGKDIDTTDFTEQDFDRFRDSLRDNLIALEIMLARPDFGDGDLSFGAELELYVIDDDGKPLHVNQKIMEKLNDPQLTLELNRYNLEYNFTPVALKDGCLHATQSEALEVIERIDKAAAEWSGHVLPVGILPTLQQPDTGYDAMTPLPRFKALTRELTELRGGPFTIAISGEDTLQLAMDDVTLEGANTSFQVHLRVPTAEFADFYNAVQLTTPLALAMSANSPTLFGHRLWQETRIPLFKQSIDCRPDDTLHPTPARVNFGNNWIRSAGELFSEAVLLYRPLLPECSDEDSLAVVQSGGTPSLNELRMHQGTIWLWNRPVYDPVDGGHLRVELRALPAGPSVVDMLANAVLAIGLAKVVQPGIRFLLPAIPFQYGTANFYRAAQSGLDAELFWPSRSQSKPEYRAVPDILKQLVPRIPDALSKMGFPEEDFMPFYQGHRGTPGDAADRRPVAAGETGGAARGQHAPAGGAARDAQAVPAAQQGQRPGRPLAVAGSRRMNPEPRPAPGQFHHWRDPAPGQVGDSCAEFLNMLPGPTHIALSGERPGRGRVAVTLMHGNEPSGLHAMHGLLRKGIRPIVDMHLFIPSVDAAKQEPGFVYRMLPQHKDLNRCFAEANGDRTPQDLLARELLRLLREIDPECCLDIHNTSGSSPAFGVATFMDERHEALVSLFTQRMIVTDLELGALMEISGPSMPAVTIECGGAADEDSHHRAFAGLFRYFVQEDVLLIDHDSVALEFFHHPMRMVLTEGTEVAFGERALIAEGVTLLPEIERLNFGSVAPGEQLGFVAGALEERLSVRDARGRERVGELFRVEAGKLRATTPLKLFMVTTNPEIARKDCLFYLVQQAG